MGSNDDKIKRIQNEYKKVVCKMLGDEVDAKRMARPMFGLGFVICVFLMAHMQHLQELAEERVTDLLFPRYFLHDVIQQKRVAEWFLLTYRDNPMYLIVGTIVLSIVCGIVRKVRAKHNVQKLTNKIGWLRESFRELGCEIPDVPGAYWDASAQRYYYKKYERTDNFGSTGNTFNAGGSNDSYSAGGTKKENAGGNSVDPDNYTEEAKEMFGFGKSSKNKNAYQYDSAYNSGDAKTDYTYEGYSGSAGSADHTGSTGSTYDSDDMTSEDDPYGDGRYYERQEDTPDGPIWYHADDGYGIRNWRGEWIDEDSDEERCDDPIFGYFGFYRYDRSNFCCRIRHMLVEDYKPGEYEAELLLLNVAPRFKERFGSQFTMDEVDRGNVSPFDSECHFPLWQDSYLYEFGDVPYYFDREDLPEEFREDYDRIYSRHMEDDFRFFKGSPQSPREVLRARTHARLIHARMFSSMNLPSWKEGCRPDGTFDSTEGGLYRLVDKDTVTFDKRQLLYPTDAGWNINAIVWDARCGFRFPTYEKFVETHPDYDWIEYLWHRRAALVEYLEKTEAELRVHFFKTKDPYYILQVSRNASQAEIKKAWRRRLSQFHPDNHQQDIEQMQNWPKNPKFTVDKFWRLTSETAKTAYEKACRDVNDAYKALTGNTK